MALKPVKTTVKHMYHQPYYKRFFSRISEQVGANTSTNRFRDRLYAKSLLLLRSSLGQKWLLFWLTYYFGLFWLSVIILAHVPKLLKIVALEIKKSFFKKRKKLVINELPCRNVMYQIFGRLSVFMIYHSFLISKFRGGGVLFLKFGQGGGVMKKMHRNRGFS